MYIWSWKEDFVIQHALIRQLTSLSIALVFTVTAMVIEFAAVIICMSFLGSYLFILGLDLFIETGFSNSIIKLLQMRSPEKIKYRIDYKVYGMLGGIFGLWVIACVWQRYFNRGKRFGLRVIKNSNNTLKVV